VDGSQAATFQNKVAVKTAKMLDWGMAVSHRTKPVVLVSGFWRSGTTWLQEMLADSIGAKTVFEPLAPANPRLIAMLKRIFPDSPDCREALIPGPRPDDNAFWRYLDDALIGKYSCHFMLSCRQKVSEALLDRIVVKDVRLQFNLEHIHARYGLPVIHLRRNPFAVAASLLAADWQWSFERVRLADLFSEPFAAPLLAELPGDVAEAIDRDALSRIAAYWAITERFIDETLGNKDWARVLSYERVRKAPQRELSNVCAWLGIDPIRMADADAPSASTHPASTRQAPGRQRRTLSEAQLAWVGEIVTQIYPAAFARHGAAWRAHAAP